MEVSLTKTFNSLYAGSIFSFSVTPNAKTEFSSTNYLYVNFPTGYAPVLGNVDCTVNGDKVPCAVHSPWWFTVTGPSSPTGMGKEFTLRVKNVRQVSTVTYP